MRSKYVKAPRESYLIEIIDQTGRPFFWRNPGDGLLMEFKSRTSAKRFVDESVLNPTQEVYPFKILAYAIRKSRVVKQKESVTSP